MVVINFAVPVRRVARKLAGCSSGDYRQTSSAPNNEDAFPVVRDEQRNWIKRALLHSLGFVTRRGGANLAGLGDGIACNSVVYGYNKSQSK
jgi:hypothetical protein